MIALAAVIAAAAPPVAAAPIPPRPIPPRPVATHDSRAVMRDFVDLFDRQVNPSEAFRRYVSPHHIQHNPAFGDGSGAALAGLENIFRAGTRLDVQRGIVDGDLAVVHVHGILQPGTPGMAVADIYRIAGGKIVEHWDVVQPVPNKAANPHPMF